MKTLSLRKIFFLVIFLFIKEQVLVLAGIEDGVSTASTYNTNLHVNAAEYCDFLNHEAINDLNFLYEEKMGSDLESACIIRVGGSGNFHYEIIAGRENDPITFVSEPAKTAYSSFADRLQATDYRLTAREQATGYRLQDEDSLLRSNFSTISIDFSSSPSLTLAAVAPTSTSTANFTSCLEEASKAATVAMFIGMMIGGGRVEASTQAEALPSERTSATASESTHAVAVQAANEAASKRHLSTPLKAESKTAEGSPESESSSGSAGSSDGKTTTERTSHGDLPSALKKEASSTEASIKKSVAFADGVIATSYQENAAEARRLGNEKLARLWDQTSNYEQQKQNIVGKNSAFRTLNGPNEKVVTLFNKASSYAQDLVETYSLAAQSFQNGDSSRATRLKGAAASYKETLDYHIRAFEASIDEHQTKTRGQDELSDLLSKASSCFAEAGDRRAPYDKKESDFWNFAATAFLRSAEIYRKVEEAFDEELSDQAELLIEACKSFKRSGEAASKAAIELANNNQELSNQLHQEAEVFFNDAERTIAFAKKIAVEDERIATRIKSLLEEKWATLSPAERKKEANDYYHKSYKIAGKAELAYRRLLNIYDEGSLEPWQNYLINSERTTEAQQLAHQARTAWSEAAEALKIGRSMSPVEIEDWWKNRIAIAEREKANWSYATSSYEVKPRGVYKPSIQDLLQFPYATVVDYETPHDFEGAKPGQKKQERILRTMYKDPFIRIEEIVDTATSTIVNREVMLADHLLVTLQKDENSEEFCKKISSLVTSIRMLRSPKSLYDLIFKYPSLLNPVSLKLLPETLKITRSLGVNSDVSPIFNIDTFPNDPIYYPTHRPDSIYGYGQWNLRSQGGGINASKAWKIRTNALKRDHDLFQSITIAVLDTGIKVNHEDFIHEDGSCNIWDDPESIFTDTPNHGWNYFDNQSDIEDCCEDGGHGTPVAGIIGAVGNNQKGIAGIAWNIKLMACKAALNNNLDSNALIDKLLETTDKIPSLQGKVISGGRLNLFRALGGVEEPDAKMSGYDEEGKSTTIETAPVAIGSQPLSEATQTGDTTTGEIASTQAASTEPQQPAARRRRVFGNPIKGLRNLFTGRKE